MLKGGVIMDVVNAEQAKIAEKAGAVAVMALERIPADIRADGGVARMSSVGVIQEVMDSVSIPVMAKARIGHFVELGCDGVFVGSGIFKSGDPAERAEAIVIATTNYNDPKVLSEVSKDLGEPMVGINIDTLSEEEKLAKRGW